MDVSSHAGTAVARAKAFAREIRDTQSDTPDLRLDR